jgi:hypothetical protein
MKTFAKLLAVSLLILTAGCGSNQIKLGKPWHLPEPTGPEDALIFGHIIIGDKASPLIPEYVRILRKGKVYAGMGLQGIGEKTSIFSDGRFVTRVKPGAFNFNMFYANQTNYQVESGKNPTWFTIEAGQIYYLGSFHAKHERGQGMFRPGEFSVQRVDKPSEHELLQWLLTISQGTGWEKKVQRRAGASSSSPASSAPNKKTKSP